MSIAIRNPSHASTSDSSCAMEAPPPFLLSDCFSMVFIWFCLFFGMVLDPVSSRSEAAAWCSGSIIA